MKKALVLGLTLAALSLPVFSQTKPKPPTHVKTVTKKQLVAKASSHSVTLGGCSDSTPGVSFNFYRGTASGQESSTALNPAPLANCSFVDTTVSGLTTYFYTAKAYLATANPNLSTASNEVTVTTPADAQPAAPTGLSVGTVSENKIPLLWNAPQKQTGYDVVAYQLYRGTQPTLPSPSLICIVPGWTLTCTDTGCSKTCYYEVKSYTIEADAKYVPSPASNIVKGTVQ